MSVGHVNAPRKRGQEQAEFLSPEVEQEHGERESLCRGVSSYSEVPDQFEIRDVDENRGKDKPEAAPAEA